MLNTVDQLKERFQLVETEISMDNTAKWGLMNAHNMIEHLSLVFLMSMGKWGKEFTGDADKAVRWKTAFYANEYPFPKNIRLPGRKEGQAPPPLHFETITKSKEALKAAVQTFLNHYEVTPNEEVAHPYFGPLSFKEWIHFHTKHMEHHLMQFGVLPEPVAK